ncbi:MAG: hypothetical protein I8H75_05635 [Myxococcaceae bacterium]|nr:hypothetical protein [Myxococcaceae bacterium]MBH2006798.1 hypothetical protein [Myxococcaceae bacterium]
MNMKFWMARGILLHCLTAPALVFSEHDSFCQEPYHDLVVAIRELAREKLFLSQNFARPETLLSVEQSFLQCFKEMIQNGSNINHADADKQTPGIVAALYHLDPVIELLRAHGADFNATDNSGYSANIILKLRR